MFCSREMFLPFLVLLGLFCKVYAGVGDCKNPKPLDNFSIKKFSGNWFMSSFDVTNLTDAARYKGAKCAVMQFPLDSEVSKSKKWHMNMIIGNKTPEIGGTYVLPDPNSGFLKLEFTLEKIIYDYTVMCTDYSTWAATYCCFQISPGHSSEYIFLLLRDNTKYEEVTDKEELKKCYGGIIDKSVKEINVVPQNNCETHSHGGA